MADPITGNKDKSSVGGEYQYVPIGSAEEMSQVGYQRLGEPIRDVIQKSETVPPAPASECDKPCPAVPDKEKTNEANKKAAIKSIQTNPWFQPSFLSAFTAVIFKLLNLQKLIQFNEAQRELIIRQKLLELAQTNAQLAKFITNTQAFEKLVQAVASFVTAGISTISFLETTKNMGNATKKIDDQIGGLKKDLGEAKIKENPATNAIDLNPKATDPEKQAHFKKLNEMIEKDNKFEYKSEEVKKHQAKLNDLEGQRERYVSDRERTLSQLTQMKGEAMKSIVQGVSGVLTATITLDRGVLEETKGLNEGELQALNKFSETSSKSRDDAKGMIDRFADFLVRIIQSSFDAHKLGRS